MTNNNTIAAPLARRPLRSLLALIAASALLSACGGGAQTTDNRQAPPTGSNNNAPYAGPAARDADVLKFQQEFWSNAKGTDRCGG